MNNGYFLSANDDKGDHQLSGAYRVYANAVNIFVFFNMNNVLEGPLPVQIELSKFQKQKLIVVCRLKRRRISSGLYLIADSTVNRNSFTNMFIR